MRFTRYTDYALRVLMYLGLKAPGELATIKEIGERYDISRNHLMKVVHRLGQEGYVETLRGRQGGLRLARIGLKQSRIRLFGKIGIAPPHTCLDGEAEGLRVFGGGLE